MFVIAGASGKTGSVVAETLLGQGKKVRVVVRSAAAGERWRARGAEVALASLDDEAALTKALAGATGFYTLLPEDPSAPDFHGHRRAMVDATARAVKASRVPYVVLLSALAAMLPDGNGPAKDLHYAESSLRATGAVVTALRACWLQENVGMALAPAMHEGIYPSFLSADVAFPTIATRDVGGVAATLLREPPTKSETVDALGPVYSTKQMADVLGKALGKELKVVEVPAAAHVDTLTGAGLPRAYAEAVAEMFACFAAGRVAPCGDRAVRGATTLDETVRALLSAPPRDR
jgi:uncharacterized protein YbjT (DUF2867 family)